MNYLKKQQLNNNNKKGNKILGNEKEIGKK
jgi:hypothetical protein